MPLDNPRMFGYCYTQQMDVFQEQNGLYTLDRRPKFDMNGIAAVQTRPAAIETGVREDVAIKVEPALNPPVYHGPPGDVVAG